MSRRRRFVVYSTTLTVALLSVVVLAFVSGAEAISGPRFFDTDCNFSHTLFVDPLLDPGDSQGSHRHNFFGNKLTDENTTADDLEDFNNDPVNYGGDIGDTPYSTDTTSCRIEDDSEAGEKRKDGAAYWTPALSYCVDNGDCDDAGSLVEPLSMHIYYRANGNCAEVCDNDPVDSAFTHTPPVGFAFIAGNPSVVNEAQQTIQTGRVGSIDWLCTSDNDRYDSAQELVAGESGNFCPGNSKLAVTIHGPECWDGETEFPDLSVPGSTPSDHVRAEAPCEEGFVRIPRLNMQIFWDDSVWGSEDASKKFRMSYAYNCGPTSCTEDWDTTEFAHFDFLNAWDTKDPDADGKTMLDRLIDGCLNSRYLDPAPYPPYDNDCNE